MCVVMRIRWHKENAILSTKHCLNNDENRYSIVYMILFNLLQLIALENIVIESRPVPRPLYSLINNQLNNDESKFVEFSRLYFKNLD